MFSKSLFRQSCKASGTMWSIITFAVCFMLACVMLIAGDGNIATTKNAIQDTIIQGEITSQLKKRSVNYYMTSRNALEHFDKKFKVEIAGVNASLDLESVFSEAYAQAVANGKTPEEAQVIALNKMQNVVSVALSKAYQNTMTELLEVYYPEVVRSAGFDINSSEALEIKGNIFMVLNPLSEESTIENKVYMFDSFYTDEKINEEPPRYDIDSINSMTDAERKIYRENYASKYSTIFLAGNIIQPENINLVVDKLESFGVTIEKYNEFGFNNYEKVKDIGTSSLVDFRANFAYRMENIKPGETEETITRDITNNISTSLLGSLPTEVAKALEEIGQEDLYGTLVGSVYFKMAGLLLPIIYLIMTANSLIAGQVDSGSMAYILSSSVKRRTVTFTQALFLVASLFVMFLLTSITSIVCISIVKVDTSLTIGKLLLINLGAFLVMFAMSGICFLFSCWFNRSKHSMGIGGGINMFFLVATMLGLFGSPILPSILRMEALNMFNYVSIISLFDVISIMDGTLAYLWKFAILIAIGIVCYFVGNEKFIHKDLPL